MKKKRNKADDQQLRHRLKEDAYTKYTDIMTSFISKEYYTGFHPTLSTFVALSMAAESAKKNLLKMGAAGSDIEQARRSAIQEIWQLMKLQETGALGQLIEQHQKEEKQANKK